MYAKTHVDSDFANSVEHYAKIQDPEINHLLEEQEKDYAASLSGKMPMPKVTVPESLTKERLLEINQKLTMSNTSYTQRST